MTPSASARPDGDATVSSLSRGQLIDVLSDTVRDLERLDLTLQALGVVEARRLRIRLIGQVKDHVLPRLQDADVPAVVVVGGSTGAGKSTLVNSVLGTDVSAAGVLRPTTRTPVLVVNPEDAAALADHPVAAVGHTVVSDAVPVGLALVDASDLDSVHEANRLLATRLLEAADLWLFVTTAARYGDQTPWASLEEAVRRQTPIAVVLNRVPARILPEVRRDLMERLTELGLAESPFVVIPDEGPHEGLLPEASVAELRDWLLLLAGRHRAAGLVRRTGRSLWTALRADLTALADDVDAQDDAATRLEAESQRLLERPTALVCSEVERGTFGEGAPTTRWLALASTGGALASLAQGGRLAHGFFGRATRARTEALALLAADAREAVAARLEAIVLSTADEAARTWAAVGAAEPAARLLPPLPDANAVVERWVAEVGATVKTVPKRMTPAGVTDLLVAGATGVAGARDAAERLGLGPALAEARSSLRQTLTTALAGVIPAGAAQSLAPDPALAAALRLRAGELIPFSRHGAVA